MTRRIGVFVCWCGFNISATVDVQRVSRSLLDYPGVAWTADYKYCCSDPGQRMLKEAIVSEGLDGVVVAACSPSMHEVTFRGAAEAAGLNPYQVEIANIREQCSWVHADREAATAKAIELVKTMVEKVRGDESLQPISVPVTKRCLVIGGGISGMQAALEVAQAGYQVILVEREPTIGGRMAQLGETFPTLDCASCILTPKTAEVGRHARIRLMAFSEIQKVSGYVGNFEVEIKKKPTYVDWDKCTGCMECVTRCPKKLPAEFERGTGQRKSIYVTFPQAVPYRPRIDRESCIYFASGRCRICVRYCQVEAIDFEQQETVVTEKVGAIIVATGYDLMPKDRFGEYGYGKIPDVIDGLEFERLNSSSGPTSGELRRPSDGKIPEEVVFIQCVGSRDQEKGMPYCSKICCMYTAKHARLFKHKVPQGQAYIFYMDVRAAGKGYEEFIQKGVDEEKLLYLRGRVARVFQDGDKVMVWGEDTLSGKKIEIAADLVVLATAMVPREDARALAQLLKIGTDAYGFFNEAHPKLRPVETLTSGIFLTGAAQAPKDIPDSVSQAGSAASKVLGLFAGDALTHAPTVVEVDAELCSGCGICVDTCPYGARELDQYERVARVREVLCQGCGACAAACPNGATRHRNLDAGQVLAMIDAVLD
ncbi:MAG: CoB--CoM heterodisulfide reductase iron-sulfur subunit A family protein [Bacillota bacterium]